MKELILFQKRKTNNYNQRFLQTARVQKGLLRVVTVTVKLEVTVSERAI